MAGEPSDTPAQVLKIVCKVPIPLPVTVLTGIFCVHEKFTTADIALKKGVHLMGITKETAIFLQVEDNCDLYNPKSNPIISMCQTAKASRMIILPISCFYTIADKIDISDRKVVWMFHTLRCGSTAWAQAFNSLPHWTVISEPPALTYTLQFGGHIDHLKDSIKTFSTTPEFKKLVKAIVKMNLYHVPANNSVFWKTEPLGNHIAGVISQEFPKHKMVLAYRDLIPSIRSYYSTFYSQSSYRSIYEKMSKDPLTNNIMKKQCNIWLTRMYYSNGYDIKFTRSLIEKVMPQGVEWVVFIWAAIIHAVTQSVRNGANIKAIKYEELKTNRREVITKVFRYVNVDVEHVDTACLALDVDSQEGSTLSKNSRTMRNAGEWKRTEDSVKRCNMLLEAFELPDLDSGINVEFDL